MSEDHPKTDPSSPVPQAAQLKGEPLDPDQPDPSEVLPMGNATEVGNLKSEGDQT